MDGNSELPIDALIDHIERTHHAFTRAEIARLQPLLQQAVSANRELAPVAETFQRLVHEVEPHMQKEEAILFPAIRAARSVEAPVQVMLLEHEEVTEILRELRERTNQFAAPFEGLEALEKDLIEHIKLEDEALFPRALALAD